MQFIFSNRQNIFIMIIWIGKVFDNYIQFCSYFAGELSFWFNLGRLYLAIFARLGKMLLELCNEPCKLVKKKKVYTWHK